MKLAYNNFWSRCISIAVFVVLVHLCESRVLIEGDMMVVEPTPGSIQNSRTESVRSKRNVLPFGRYFHWDSGVIPYEIDATAGFDDMQIARVNEAMRHWERFTCIIFVERNPIEHKDFIRFITNDTKCGCCSNVGKQSGGQNVRIGACDFSNIRNIAHELGHAIGFHHEHQRPDRDEYVEVKGDYESDDISFGKVSFLDTLNEPYDLESIMHYSQYYFQPKKGKNGVVPNLVHNKRLSATDIRKTNKLYCPECGGVFFDEKGSFTSPEYFSKPSTSRTFKCEWRITVADGERIKLEISTLDLFRMWNDCGSDYLEVRDGYSRDSPLLGRFCGSYIIDDMLTVFSSGNRMIINYFSSHMEFRGFAATYETYSAP